MMKNRLLSILVMLGMLMPALAADHQLTFKVYGSGTVSIDVPAFTQMGLNGSAELRGDTTRTWTLSDELLQLGALSASLQFQPDDGYSIAQVYVNDQYDVTQQAQIGNFVLSAQQSVVAQGLVDCYVNNAQVAAGLTDIEVSIHFQGQQAQEPVAYAVLAEDSTQVLSQGATGITFAKTLTFYYDTHMVERNGMEVGVYTSEMDRGWYQDRQDITTVNFDASFAEHRPTSTAYWFYGLTGLTTVNGVENLNTAGVSSMRSMFGNCTALTELDLSSWNTESLTNLHMAFMGCSALTSLNLRGWNTTRLTDTHSMVQDCSALTAIDLSTFNTAAVTDMRYMFYGCRYLRTIWVGSGWTTSGLSSTSFGGNMFGTCSRIVGGMGTTYDSSHTGVEYARIDGGADAPGYLTDIADTAAVAPVTFSRDMYELTLSCETPNVTIYYELIRDDATVFVEGHSWTEYAGPITLVADCGVWAYAARPSRIGSEVSYYGFKMSDVATDEAYAVLTEDSTQVLSQGSTGITFAKTLTFYYDKKKQERGGMDIGPFESGNSRPWHNDAASITEVVFDSSFANDTTVTSTEWWFLSMSNLTTITGIENLNTSNVTSMEGMFYGCSKLTSIDVSHFDTHNVTNMLCMFQNCYALTSLDVSNFDTSKADIAQMFNGCQGLTSLTLGNLGAGKSAFRFVFGDCSSLKSIDLSSFETSNTTDFTGMFQGCSSLETLDLSNFNTEKAINMPQMFYGCSALKTIYVGSGWTTAALSGEYSSYMMFSDCTSLVGGQGTTYDANHVDAEYARIDHGPNSQAPGYLTDKDVAKWDVWSVIGTINGMWNKDTDMATEDGVHYTTTITVAEAGTYEYKVRANNSWDLNYGADGQQNGGNISVTVPEDGTSVTINFDAETHAITHTVNLVYSVPGSFNDWQLAANDMTLDAETGLYYATLDLQAGDYEYKVAANHGWDVNYGVGGQRDGTNLSLTVTENGPVTIWFNSETKLTGTDRDALLPSPWIVSAGDDDVDMTTMDMVNYTAEFFPVEAGTHQYSITNRNEADRKIDLSVNVEEDNTTVIISLNTQTAETSAQQVAPVYSVIGADTGFLNYEGWLRWEEDADMTKGEDGLYSVRFDNMAAGEYAYKVRVNHSWDVNYGLNGVTSVADNIPMTIEADSTDIIIYFDPQTKLTSVEVVTPTPAVVEPYVVIADNDTVIDDDTEPGTTYGKTLTFYYDDKKEERGGVSVERGLFYWPWIGMRSITKAVFDASYAQYRPTDLADFFYNCSNLATIEGFQNLVTDSVTTMKDMFNYCKALESIDVSHFNTSSLSNVDNMFAYCSSLKTINASGLVTDRVTSLLDLFQDCSSLTDVNMSGWNTQNVTQATQMFRGCSSLTEIDLSDMNFESLQYVVDMFSFCSNLEKVDISSMSSSKLVNMQEMFWSCTSLKVLDLSCLNTETVTRMMDMLRGCTALTTVYVSDKWNTESVQEPRHVFYDNFNLVGGRGTTYSQEHTNVDYARIDGGPDSETPGYFTDINLGPYAGRVAKPTFSWSGDELTIATATEGAQVLYSLTAPVDPDVASGNGTLESPYNATAARRYAESLASGNTSESEEVGDTTGEPVYIRGIVSGVQYPFDTTYGNGTFYISNDGTHNNEFGAYGVNYLNNAKYDSDSLRNVQVGDEVIIYGQVTLYNGFPETLQGQAYLYAFVDEDFKAYEAPLTITSNVKVKAYAVKEGMIDSELATLDYNYDSWEDLMRAIADVAYVESVAANSPKAERDDVRSMLDELLYMAAYGRELYDQRTAEPETVNELALRIRQHASELLELLYREEGEANLDTASGVLTVSGEMSMTDALEAAGGQAVVNNTLTAIVWDNQTTVLTEEDLQGITNPNVLIFVNDESLAPRNRNNVVVNGYAKNVVLTDASEGNNDFYSPRDFTAEMVSYTRNFTQQTEVGVSRGWETICLPFTVQTITHERNGVIAPFGSSDSDKHFWLRELAQAGLRQATQIERDKPFLISMPNSENYAAERNLAGRVTFSSENVTIYASSLDYSANVSTDSVGNETLLQPTMKRVAQAEGIYALNVGAPQSGYAEGSVFVSNLRDVRPFECYTRHIGSGHAPQFMPVSQLGSTTGIELVTGGTLQGEHWYDLNGRRLQGKPTAKGVYILNGRKTVVR